MCLIGGGGGWGVIELHLNTWYCSGLIPGLCAQRLNHGWQHGRQES